ncbi:MULTISPECIES: competence/damage-inducible protein A [unclassified Haladaptatus]|uniref:competence/damage-inducible protein A n=1 Tax=unclassified Haladaptatus TaxID=2622732 RepID=UPI0023E84019|nr:MULTISPECIES: competence/damage-inducible protein A [unclassified Haladaptatus]
MHVALLTVGDELLAGDIDNTNASWLARQLGDRGVSVVRILVVPDDEEVIADHVRAYSTEFDAVVVTGGLGGTPDDVTMAAVARAFDRELVVNDAALVAVEERLAEVADRYPDLEIDAEAEASIPEGARVLVNDAGLSPGCVANNVYALPGIPSEMKAMFEQVADEFSGAMQTRTLYTPTPEGQLLGVLGAVRERFDVEIGCYPNREQRRNRLKLRSEDAAALDAAETWLRDEIETV